MSRNAAFATNRAEDRGHCAGRGIRPPATDHRRAGFALGNPLDQRLVHRRRQSAGEHGAGVHRQRLLRPRFAVSLDYFDQQPFAFNENLGPTTIKYGKSFLPC